MATAKRLYEFLEMDASHYSRWFKKNIIKNQFAEENTDYFPFALNGECGGQASVDAKLTASFAEKLSMMQKNEKGEAARNYFVGVENGTSREVSLTNRQRWQRWSVNSMAFCFPKISQKHRNINRYLYGTEKGKG